MKKLSTMLACALLAIGTAAAQNTKTYTGMVIDKYGNPVVGAEVSAPGGGATTITESDGSFSIEVPSTLDKLTASYTGMLDKSIKLNDQSKLVFKMKNMKKMTGFVSIIVNAGYWTHPDNDHSNYHTYSDITLGGGIMGGQIGQLGKWGWYGKLIGTGSLDHGDVGVSLTAGAIRKLRRNTHLYFGVGPALNYDWMGFALDLGTIFVVSKHINIIAGLNYSIAFDIYDCVNNINLNIGVGYVF